MGNVKRTDVQELSDTVEWDNQKLGCMYGLAIMALLWFVTDVVTWRVVWIFLFGEGRGY